MKSKIEELSKQLTWVLFADRATLGEAVDYVTLLAKHSGDGVAVWTAVGVMVNSIGRELRKICQEQGNE